MMNSVLVTGCNGTVGRHTCHALLNAGYRVVGLSLEPTSPIQHERFVYTCVDLTDADAVDALVAQERAATLVHLAALVHVRSDELSFVDYCRLNYQASKHLFAVAAANGTKRVVFSSTIEVYGQTPDGTTVDESYPCRPDSDYAKTKLLAEGSLTDTALQYGIRVAILRLAPVYAPDFRLNLDKRLYLAPHIAYYVGRGRYRLDLCSVRNIEHFIVRWIAMDPSPSGTFNLADSRSYGITGLLEREARAGRSRLTLRVPFWPAVAGAAAFEIAMSLFGRSAGMYTANNVRKLARSTHWDTSRAIAAVGSLPFDIDNTLGGAP